MNSDSSQESVAPAIEFRHVFLSFDDNPALVDVSFQLGHREMMFLTGKAGAGKSVLLKVAIGLLQPDEGQIFIDGHEIETLDETDLLAIRGGSMGMVFQEDSLFSSLTVYENAAYRLEENGWSEEKIEKSVSEVLQFVGLEGEEDRLPDELSGGMKRRLEIARGLIGYPPIMLFDEATTMLDPIVASQILDLIISARDIHKITSLYVTKRVDELPYLANYRASEGSSGEIVVHQATPENLPPTKVMVLEAGRIIFSGSLIEFQHSEVQAIKELNTQDPHDHSDDPYFSDPWDRTRKPKEKI